MTAARSSPNATATIRVSCARMPPGTSRRPVAAHQVALARTMRLAVVVPRRATKNAGAAPSRGKIQIQKGGGPVFGASATVWPVPAYSPRAAFMSASAAPSTPPAKSPFLNAGTTTPLVICFARASGMAPSSP